MKRGQNQQHEGKRTGGAYRPLWTRLPSCPDATGNFAGVALQEGSPE